MQTEVRIGKVILNNEEIEAGKVNIPCIKGDAGEIISLEIVQIGVNEIPKIENNGSRSEAKIKIYIPENTKIIDMGVNKDYHLITTLNTGQEIDCGYVRGAGIIGASIRNGILFFILENEVEVEAGNILSEENIIDIKKYCETYTDETIIALNNMEIEEILKR